jgi:glycosyltransferase involved in cell wall biosynthesis
MKVAIVHDWLANMGGSERCVLAFHELFPDAPVFTTVYNQDKLPDEFKALDIRPSFIQKLPKAKTNYQTYLPLMPIAVEQFDLTEFDVVITSSHACAKGVITRPDAINICYCYTPIRYVWQLYHEYMRLEEMSRLKKLLIPPIMNYLRMWDRLAADRVDEFVGISRIVAQRIRKYYRRDAAVIYPPVDTQKYKIGSSIEDYYLVVSRLVPYKRVDLAVAACSVTGQPLLVVGDGPEYSKLKEIAGPTVKFLGRISDEEIVSLYASCKAFIFPGNEDFGMTPVEAQAAGRPVIAFGSGGCLETVVPGVTGEFFSAQTPEALAEIIRKFDAARYNPLEIRKNAERFDKEVFNAEIRKFIDTKYREFCSR